MWLNTPTKVSRLRTCSHPTIEAATLKVFVVMPHCKRCGSWVNRASTCKICHRLDKMESTRGIRKCDECGTTIPLWEEWCKECWEVHRRGQDDDRWPPVTWAREGWSTASSSHTSWPLPTSPAPTWTLAPTYSGEWPSDWSWHEPTWQPKVDQSKSQWNSTSACLPMSYDEGKQPVAQWLWTPLSQP